jgi:hypothetical protein
MRCRYGLRSKGGQDSRQTDLQEGKMAQPIFKMYMGNPTEAWYQLSQDEQDELLAKIGEALEKVGGKVVVSCNSQWASEQCQFFGVEEFPHIEAVQKLTEIHNELNWLRYIDSTSVLGTEWEPS